MRGSVHRILAGMAGSAAHSWQTGEPWIRTFLAAGGAVALQRHGFAFAGYEGGGVMVERVDKAVATPAGLFLQLFDLTGDRGMWVSAAVVRGMWHAEHVTMPVTARGGGSELLLSLGAARGRVPGVGAVLRGVRLWDPMTVDEVAAVFA